MFGSSHIGCLRFNSFASLEAELARVKLWEAGPNRKRVVLPIAFDGFLQTLLSNDVGESPFQDWGGSFVVHLYLGSTPPTTVVDNPIVSGLGISQRSAGVPCDGGHEGAFVFDVLCTVDESAH